MLAGWVNEEQIFTYVKRDSSCSLTGTLYPFVERQFAVQG